MSLCMALGGPVALHGPAMLLGPPVFLVTTALLGTMVPKRRHPVGVSVLVPHSPVMVMPVMVVFVGQQGAIRTHGSASRPWIASAPLGNRYGVTGSAALRIRRGGTGGDESEQANEHHPGHTTFHGQATF
ncbi:hypothetical protein [Azotobacter salinestris]|uniref:hypothetical protein n=1 Tax=Azotobacter salinestris TaxID=69964 RepID=UPI0032DED084